MLPNYEFQHQGDKAGNGSLQVSKLPAASNKSQVQLKITKITCLKIINLPT